MTPLEPTLRLGIETLRDLGAGFALVGGLAVSSWAEPRTTRDIDLAVAVESDSHAEELAFHMRSVGYEIASGPSPPDCSARWPAPATSSP
ncbi:MAG: hypothetical protein ACT4QG_06515 [Sporichthyaceae bacterium]